MMLLQSRLHILLLLCLSGRLSTQPLIEWDRTIGGEHYEELNAICIASDGVCIGGSSKSNIAYGRPGDTSWNILIAKTDLGGQLLWSRLYGGSDNERLWAMSATSDGGYLAGGYSFSGSSGDKTQPSRGERDIWLLRLDREGHLLWEKTYGGDGREELFSIVAAPQGGYYLGCHSASNGGYEKSEMCRGYLDFWILYIDEQGNLLWDKTIGGDGVDQLSDLYLLPNGHLLASGGTSSARNTGEVGDDFARGNKDFWLMEFDPASRQKVWDHRHGGTGEEFAYALCVTANNKIYLGGPSGSDIAPPTAINNGKNAPFYGGQSDYWLIELNMQGQKLNEWSFGGSGLDDLYMIEENYLGQLHIGGVTDSEISGNKTAPHRGNYDFWAITLDPNTGIVWQRTLGGTKIDSPTQLKRFSNGAFIYGGQSESNQGFEKSQNTFGVNDFWVVKTLCNTGVHIENITTAPPCSGQPALLTATTWNCDNCQIYWNTESLSDTLVIAPGETGTFIVRAIDQNACIAMDTLVFHWPLAPEFDLGPADTLIQQGSTLSLGIEAGNYSFLWNTGATTPNIQIDHEGIYAVTVTNSDGCSITDAINVGFLQEIKVWAPNAFHPGDETPNNYFTIFSNNTIKEISSLEIADRWGNLIFRNKHFPANAIYEGWDGYFRNEMVEAGVYLWVAELITIHGKRLALRGDITVIR